MIEGPPAARGACGARTRAFRPDLRNTSEATPRTKRAPAASSGLSKAVAQQARPAGTATGAAAATEAAG